MMRLSQWRLGIDNVLSREALEARSDKVTSSPNMMCVWVCHHLHESRSLKLIVV